MEAFVIQPIRDSQDPDHDHFKAIYSRVNAVLKSRDFECHRADEIQKSGAITKDIVTRLAFADLVVADLTDLNPNVYYELGVRHALRGSGTILLLDEARTPHIPFDLGAYRVIKFEGTLPGISRLEERLTAALDDGAEFSPHSDNPVHDWLPELPSNALAAADGSEAGELRRMLKEQEDLVSRYRDRFGMLEGPLRPNATTPLSVVMTAVAAADEGNTPSQLVREAEQATQIRDVSRFLSVVRRVLENNIKIDKGEALTLAFSADRLGIEDVGRAVLEYVTGYLDDDSLEQAILAKFAHSTDPSERVSARVGLARRAEVKLGSDGEIVMPTSLRKAQTMDVGLLLDSLDKDGNFRGAFAIAYRWAINEPNSSFVLRHLARSYAALGRRDLSLQVYRAALAAPDLDDTTPRWLGSDYHNSQETVNALEAYTFAARHDPDDSSLFAHAADELSGALLDRLLGRTSSDGRLLPAEISQSDFEACLRSSISCTTIDQESIARLEQAARRIDAPGIEDMANAARMDLAERHKFALELFEKLSSTATELLQQAPEGGWPDLRSDADLEELSDLVEPDP